MTSPSTPQELAATYRAQARRLRERSVRLRDAFTYRAEARRLLEEAERLRPFARRSRTDPLLERAIVFVVRAEQLEREGR